MTARILFHVGYHKTATSWMQNLLFTPEHGYAQLMGHDEVDRLITRPHGLDFDPEPAREAMARARARIGPGLVPVVSSELLSGHPFFGGRESDVFAARLRAIEPCARVLVSIRAQGRILPSVYMQYLLRGGTLTPEEFFEGESEWGFHGFSAAHFEYDRLVKLYQSLFGRERVHVLQQEALAADMEGAAARLANFADAARFAGLSAAARRTYAPSYPEHAVPVLRRINHVQRSVLNRRPVVALGATPFGLYRMAGGALRRRPFSGLMGARHPVSDHVARRFAGRFAASNRRLADIAGPLDMSAYEMASDTEAGPAAVSGPEPGPELGPTAGPLTGTPPPRPAMDRR